MNLEES